MDKQDIVGLHVSESPLIAALKKHDIEPLEEWTIGDMNCYRWFAPQRKKDTTWH